MNIKCLCCRRPKHSWDQRMAGSCWSIYLSICLGCDSLVTRWCMGRSVCGHRRLMDSSRNLHDPTIHSARRWQGWNVSCVNVANNDITIKQNAIMSCSYDNLHEPVSITVTCNMDWGDPGCLTMRTRTNWAVTPLHFLTSYN